MENAKTLEQPTDAPLTVTCGGGIEVSYTLDPFNPSALPGKFDIEETRIRIQDDFSTRLVANFNKIEFHVSTSLLVDPKKVAIRLKPYGKQEWLVGIRVPRLLPECDDTPINDPGFFTQWTSFERAQQLFDAMCKLAGRTTIIKEEDGSTTATRC